MTTEDESTAGAHEQLDQLRQRIDALDSEILDLLNERARCALDVAEVKQAAGGRRVVEKPRGRRVVD